jgi:ribose 5-phosphate isomerase B
MKIGVASDHRGIELKRDIIDYLNSQKILVEDCGAYSSESVDYPDFAFAVGKKVISKEIDYGVLICGTGIGMCIAANKIKGIRCANAHNVEEAFLSRSHNDANIIAVSSSLTKENVFRLIERFINTPFSNEERHIRRIEKITNLENM